MEPSTQLLMFQVPEGKQKKNGQVGSAEPGRWLKPVVFLTFGHRWSPLSRERSTALLPGGLEPGCKASDFLTLEAVGSPTSPNPSFFSLKNWAYEGML